MATDSLAMADDRFAWAVARILETERSRSTRTDRYYRPNKPEDIRAGFEEMQVGTYRPHPMRVDQHPRVTWVIREAGGVRVSARWWTEHAEVARAESAITSDPLTALWLAVARGWLPPAAQHEPRAWLMLCRGSDLAVRDPRGDETDDETPDETDE